MTARTDFAACLLTVSALSCGFDPSALTGGSDDNTDAGRLPPPVDDATPGSDGEPPLADGAPELDAAFACPPGYQAVPETGSAYRTGTDLAWQAAEGACEADGPGAHLVVIDDATENATVDALSAASRVWIGYSDLATANTWRWVTSEPGLDDLWDAGNAEPNGSGDCAVINSDGEWRDQNCAEQRDYLCECDGRSADPDAF